MNRNPSSYRLLLALLAGLLLSSAAHSFSDQRALDPEDRSRNWSMGFAYTFDELIYAGEESQNVDFLPTFVFTGERFFLDTTDFGWHAIDTKQWQLDVFGSYFIKGYNDHSFVSETGAVRPPDDPLKGMERENALEAGLELTRKTNYGRFGLELKYDASNVHHGGEARGHWSKVYRGSDWQLEPWAELTWLSEQKADYYYGVREQEASDSRPAYIVEASGLWGVGVAGRYTPWRQHHFNINLAYRAYADSIANSPIVADDTGVSVQLGYRYELSAQGDRNYDSSSRSSAVSSRSDSKTTSLRIAYGCTTRTKFIDILQGDINCSDLDTGLASVFAAKKVSNEMFTLPIEVWVQGGIARRVENDLQSDFWESVFAVKAIFRRFPWSHRVNTRVGFSNGVSYADKIPFIEQEKAETKNRQTSHLLHYLEFSLDLSLGDVFGIDRLRNLYGGIYVHHRSGIFANSNIYNNADGGSNVNMLHLEWEFD